MMIYTHIYTSGKKKSNFLYILPTINKVLQSVYRDLIPYSFYSLYFFIFFIDIYGGGLNILTIFHKFFMELMSCEFEGYSNVLIL